MHVILQAFEQFKAMHVRHTYSIVHNDDDNTIIIQTYQPVWPEKTGR